MGGGGSDCVRADDGSAVLLSIRTLMISTHTTERPRPTLQAAVVRRFAPGDDGGEVANAPAISPDGRRTAVGRKRVGTDDGSLEIVDLATGNSSPPG